MGPNGTMGPAVGQTYNMHSPHLKHYYGLFRRLVVVMAELGVVMAEPPAAGDSDGGVVMAEPPAAGDSDGGIVMAEPPAAGDSDGGIVMAEPPAAGDFFAFLLTWHLKIAISIGGQ